MSARRRWSAGSGGGCSPAPGGLRRGGARRGGARRGTDGRARRPCSTSPDVLRSEIGGAGVARAAAAAAGGHRRPGQRRRARCGSTGATGRSPATVTSSPTRPTVRRLAVRLVVGRRPSARRCLAVRGRPARRRHPGPCRAAAAVAARHLHLAAGAAAPHVHAGRPGRGRVAAGRGGRLLKALVDGAGWRSWSRAAPAAARPRCCRRCCRRPPGRAPGARRGCRRAASRPPARRAARGPGRQRRRGRRRDASRSWSVRRCGCDRTGWWSARCAAARCSTCSPRSTPVTRAGAAPSTPTAPSTCRRGSSRCARGPGCPATAAHSLLLAAVDAVIHLGARRRRPSPDRRHRGAGRADADGLAGVRSGVPLRRPTASCRAPAPTLSTAGSARAC